MNDRTPPAGAGTRGGLTPPSGVRTEAVEAGKDARKAGLEERSVVESYVSTAEARLTPQTGPDRRPNSTVGGGVRPGRLRPALKLTESCNLSCSYCYQEGRLGPDHFMDTVTLDRILEELSSNTTGPMHLLWYGGEPTLFGTQRFADALDRAGQAFSGRTLYHGIQTNATQIDEEWADLLALHRFAVTTSLDGPEWLHDAQRPDRRGRGTHGVALAGIRALQARGIQPRVSAVITPRSLPHAEDLVDYFAEAGLPEVDFVPSTRCTRGRFEIEVDGAAFADFIVRVFERWLQLGRPGFRVRFLAELARKMAGHHPYYCKLEQSCSEFVVFGYNGDVYPCDEFSGIPEYLLGNLHESSLAEIRSSPRAQAHFQEWASVPPACQACRWVKLCQGGCPWERQLTGAQGNPTLMCPAMKAVFERMARELPGSAERWGAVPAGA